MTLQNLTQGLKVWAKTKDCDAATNSYQRRDVSKSEWNTGWLRGVQITSQALNSIFYLLTSYSNPTICSPYLHLKTKPLPEDALLQGTPITQEQYPVLYSFYGDTLPISDAPTGFTYVYRKQ